MAARFLIALSCAFLLGCSYGYVATGRIEGFAAPLQGKADLRTAGGGKFTLGSPADELMCEGLAQPPVRPAATLGCTGEEGVGRLRCSDGREFDFHWKALNCRAFAGEGVGPMGEKLKFQVHRHNP